MLGLTEFISANDKKVIRDMLKRLGSEPSDYESKENCFTTKCELVSLVFIGRFTHVDVSLDAVFLRSCNKLLMRAL